MEWKWKSGWRRSVRLATGVALAVFALGCQTGDAEEAGQPQPVRLASAQEQEADEGATKVVVYKSPTCGCCGDWVVHMREHGFQVETKDLNDSDLAATKTALGVPLGLTSCHTAEVGGYLVEGHVPADVIQRMLDEQPEITGIAVPGMPIGSPGMEMGSRKDPYNVIAFTEDGKQTIYEKR